jgi:hypothetical protein
MPPRPARNPPERPAPVDPRGERRARALEAPLDVRVRPDPRFPRLEVRNPVRQTRYDVLLPDYPEREGAFCTCADFAHRTAGTCKHLEAAWIWIGEHPNEFPPSGAGEAVASEGWASVDRQLRAQGKSRAPLPQRYRIAGAALFRR